MENSASFFELISIIIPVYNVEPFLEQCVTSVLNQTYSNIEVILVDDGSTDYSGVLCDSLADSYEKVKVIHKKNGGLSSARNEGIKMSSAKYVIFVDSDDTVDKDMCLNLVNGMNKNNSDLVVGSLAVIKDDKEFYKEPLVSINETTLYGQENLNLILSGKNYSACGKLYKKELFEEIRFPEGKLDEDYAIMYKIVLKAKSVTYIPKYVYRYVFRNGSITKSSFSYKKMDFVKNARAVYEDLKQRKDIQKHFKKMAKSFYLKRCNWYITDIFSAKNKSFKKIMNHLRNILLKNIVFILFNNYFTFKEKIVVCLNIFSPSFYFKRLKNK